MQMWTLISLFAMGGNISVRVREIHWGAVAQHVRTSSTHLGIAQSHSRDIELNWRTDAWLERHEDATRLWAKRRCIRRWGGREG
jgi:hypothetical protein